MRAVLAFLLTLYALPAHAQTGNLMFSGFAPSACPYPTDGGCAAAPAGGTFQNAAFFASAAQSGQSWTSSHPPISNMAGVDYAIGPTIAVGSMTDPAGGHTGCTYSATANGGSPRLTCNGAANLSIIGYNFGPVGGHGCTQLYLQSLAGSLTLKNDNFELDAGCAASSLALVQYNSAYSNSGVTSTADIESNTFEGHATDPCCTTGALYAIAQNFGGNVVFRYNTIRHWPGRPIALGTVAPGGVTWAYNYFEGWNYRAPQGHAEATIASFGAVAPATMALNDLEYNVFWQTSDACNCGEAPIYASDGNSGNTYTQTTINGNVLVINTVGGGAAAGVTASGNMVGGVLTISATTGTIRQGQGAAGTALTLYTNTGGGTGGGSTWLTDCASQATTTQCPVAPIFGNTATASVPSVNFGNIVANAAASLAHETYTAVTITNNWIDTTGTNGTQWRTSNAICGATIVPTGNFNLITGAAANTVSNSGSTGC